MEISVVCVLIRNVILNYRGFFLITEKKKSKDKRHCDSCLKTFSELENEKTKGLCCLFNYK